MRCLRPAPLLTPLPRFRDQDGAGFLRPTHRLHDQAGRCCGMPAEEEEEEEGVYVCVCWGGGGWQPSGRPPGARRGGPGRRNPPPARSGAERLCPGGEGAAASRGAPAAHPRSATAQRRWGGDGTGRGHRRAEPPAPASGLSGGSPRDPARRRAWELRKIRASPPAGLGLGAPLNY